VAGSQSQSQSQPQATQRVLFECLVRRWSASATASAQSGLVAEHDRVALELGSERISYGELHRLVGETCDLLERAEVRRGDRVVVLFPTSPEYVVAVLAITALGAIAVPVPTGASTDRLAYIAGITEPRFCLHGEGISPPDGVAAHCLVLATDTGRPPASPARSSIEGATSEDEAMILFSSGSTGRPKGVVLRHRHLLATAQNLSSVFGLDADHRELIVAPMYHSDGWQRVAATLYVGGCVVMSKRALNPKVLLESIGELSINGFFIPPPMLRLLLRSPPDVFRLAMKTVRSLELGSAPVTAAELRHVAEQIPSAKIFFHYGLTECSRAVILSVRDDDAKLDTVGAPAPGVSLRIRDASGRDVGPGEQGQIWLRGKQQTDGYFKLPELDRERFVDGWLATGDYGSVDADGYLTLLGRRDDMITSAGFHFFPAEVETELGALPGIVDYVIAGIPDASGILGQVPWAFVVAADASHDAPARIIAYARSKLPPHMVPRQVVVIPAIPLTPSGKPDRAKTAALFAKTTT
jgi:long-chain acyl-CoA synthetase